MEDFSPRPRSDEEMVSEAHPELHHYTNYKGLSGIWGSQALWSLRYDQMNDPTEFNHAKELFINAIKPTVAAFFDRRKSISPALRREQRNDPTLTAEKYAEIKAPKWVGGLFQAMDVTHDGHPFVVPHITSFCAHPDSYERENGLLSLWRGYGGEQQAFAIVFDTKKLEQLIAEELKKNQYIDMKFFDVLYNLDDQKTIDEFKSIIDQLFGAWEQFERGKRPDFGYLLEPLLHAATRIKHRAFKEEGEVRIVSFPVHPNYAFSRTKGEDRRHTKQHYSEPRPHISLFDNLADPLPIKRIVVGPCLDQDAAYKSAKQVVAGVVPVEVSRTPFRIFPRD